MTKNELKALIKDVISEANTKELQKLGFSVVDESFINVHHRVKLSNLKKDGWGVDGWADKKNGVIKVIRTNPKNNKLETGIVDRKGNFTVVG